MKIHFLEIKKKFHLNIFNINQLGKAALGKLVHKKTATAVALTEVRNEVNPFSNIYACVCVCVCPPIVLLLNRLIKFALFDRIKVKLKTSYLSSTRTTITTKNSERLGVVVSWVPNLNTKLKLMLKLSKKNKSRRLTSDCDHLVMSLHLSMKIQSIENVFHQFVFFVI